jgi:hypothetical protein
VVLASSLVGNITTVAGGASSGIATDVTQSPYGLAISGSMVYVVEVHAIGRKKGAILLKLATMCPPPQEFRKGLGLGVSRARSGR